eukprot:g1808.t1
MSRAAVIMMMVGIWAAITAVADGHLYLMEPTSRNFFYTTTFQSPGFDGLTYCPHCMQSRGPAAVAARALELTSADALSNYGDGAWPHLTAYNRGELASNGNFLENDEISVRHGICGDPEQTAAEGANVFGQENSVYPVLETYQEGSVIEMKVVVSTYHWGHLEFHICNSENLSDPDGPVTQGCFNMHPLDRADDDGDASPIDPDHPGRYYVDPPCRAAETDQTKPDGAHEGYVVTGRYKLPEGLTCNRCIVQMVYYTGHVCKLPGYDDFTPDSLPEGCAQSNADWINLNPPACGEGQAYPEGGSSSSSAGAGSRSSSVDEPTPTPSPSPAPTPSPSPSSSSSANEDSTSYPQDRGDGDGGEESDGVNDDDETGEEEEEGQHQDQDQDQDQEQQDDLDEDAPQDEVQENGASSACHPLEGSGSWLEIDLPHAASLSSIELAFEDGDERTQDFEIVVMGETDMSTTFYTSSGETNDFQRFSSFADGGSVMAKTVTIVGYGNSLNDWNSFTEIKLCQ